jgi:hypothetical protein
MTTFNIQTKTETPAKMLAWAKQSKQVFDKYEHASTALYNALVSVYNWYLLAFADSEHAKAINSCVKSFDPKLGKFDVKTAKPRFTRLIKATILASHPTDPKSLASVYNKALDNCLNSGRSLEQVLEALEQHGVSALGTINFADPNASKPNAAANGAAIHAAFANIMPVHDLIAIARKYFGKKFLRCDLHDEDGAGHCIVYPDSANPDVMFEFVTATPFNVTGAGELASSDIDRLFSTSNQIPWTFNGNNLVRSETISLSSNQEPKAIKPCKLKGKQLEKLAKKLKSAVDSSKIEATSESQNVYSTNAGTLTVHWGQ